MTGPRLLSKEERERILKEIADTYVLDIGLMTRVLAFDRHADAMDDALAEARAEVERWRKWAEGLQANLNARQRLDPLVDALLEAVERLLKLAPSRLVNVASGEIQTVWDMDGGARRDLTTAAARLREVRTADARTVGQEERP